MLNTWVHKDTQILQLTRMPRLFAVVIFWSAPSSPASKYRRKINCFTEIKKTIRQLEEMSNSRYYVSYGSLGVGAK